ncbi:MAG: TatD family hydrolase [Candidatus Pacebacteria bacterium]|nr:TatD family hydrolase [Candidatus Paceibacterota bacterium]
MFKYIDIHAHLDMPAFDKDREELILKLQKENIGVITIAVDKQSSFRAVELADRYDNIFASIGFHPVDAAENFCGSDFAELIQHPKVVAVGECGLDFFRLTGDFETEKKKQQNLFEVQINFAVEHDKPLMVHCRDAHPEVLDILKSKKKELGDKLRGDIHFFSGDRDVAKQYFDLDFCISFGGVLTFTDAYDEVVRFAPLDRIMSETDAPFVAPVPYRGKRNEPAFVKYVVAKIAEIRREDFEKVRKILVQNAFRVFALKG